jgi:ribosome assembly protein YihI (activator of Der GTPase)
MTPEQALERREKRIDALIDRVESGKLLSAEDWAQLGQLNTLDLMSVEQGAARQVLELENEADGMADGIFYGRTEQG